MNVEEEKPLGKKILGFSILITMMISLAVVGLATGGGDKDSDYSVEELSAMSYNLPNGQLVRCLNEHNVSIYISKTCSHCSIQKELFGDSFWGLNYTDCGLEGSDCGFLEGVPSWVDNNYTVYPGVKSLEELGIMFGC